MRVLHSTMKHKIKTNSLDVIIPINRSFKLSNKFFCTPFFAFCQFLIQTQYDRIHDQRNSYRIYNFRQDNINKIISDLETAPEQKEQGITQDVEDQIADGDQAERQLDILRKKYFPEIAEMKAKIAVEHTANAGE